MALIECRECGHEVSTKAKSCPNCGAIQKNERGCSYYFVIGILFLVILIIYGSIMDNFSPQTTRTIHPASSSKKNLSINKKKTYSEGKTVSIGDMSFLVMTSRWTHQLSDNELLDEMPDAMYLFIELTIRNDDVEARPIPEFKLIDENGFEYKTSNKAWIIKDALRRFEKLNPGVSKTGLIIFDIPMNHSYKLRLSNRHLSGESAFVMLEPSDLVRLIY